MQRLFSPLVHSLLIFLLVIAFGQSDVGLFVACLFLLIFQGMGHLWGAALWDLAERWSQRAARVDITVRRLLAVWAVLPWYALIVLIPNFEQNGMSAFLFAPPFAVGMFLLGSRWTTSATGQRLLAIGAGLLSAVPACGLCRFLGREADRLFGATFLGFLLPLLFLAVLCDLLQIVAACKRNTFDATFRLRIAPFAHALCVPQLLLYWFLVFTGLHKTGGDEGFSDMFCCGFLTLPLFFILLCLRRFPKTRLVLALLLGCALPLLPFFFIPKDSPDDCSCLSQNAPCRAPMASASEQRYPGNAPLPRVAD